VTKQGDRRATGGSGLTAFAIDSEYGLEAVEEFKKSVNLNRPWRGVDVHFLDPDAAPEDMDDRNAAKKFKEFSLEAKKAFRDAGLPLVDGKAIKVTTFLNRLLGLQLKLQTQVFSYWHIIMQELIRDAKSTGKFQEGILDIGSELVLEKESVLFEDAGEGTRTCLNRLVGDRGVSWEQAKKLMEDQEDRCSGIYRKRARKDRSDVYNIFLALEKKQMVKNRSQRTFVTVEPHSGFRPDEVAQRDLRRDYEMLSNEDAEEKWKAVYELSKDKCACKVCDDPATCELKKRTRAYHILTGSVLPFWNTIKSYMQAHEEHLDAEEGFAIKVVRVETRDNRRLVGILIPNENAAKLKEKILEHARRLVSAGASSGTIPDQKDAGMQLDAHVPRSSPVATSVETSNEDAAAAHFSVATVSQARHDLSESSEEEEEGEEAEEDDTGLVIDETEEEVDEGMAVEPDADEDQDLELVAEEDEAGPAVAAIGRASSSGADDEGVEGRGEEGQAALPQHAGDDTEDESDMEEDAGQASAAATGEACQAVQDARQDVACAEAPSSAAAGAQAPAQLHTTEFSSRARDSILSHSDTPEKAPEEDEAGRQPAAASRALLEAESTSNAAMGKSPSAAARGRRTREGDAAEDACLPSAGQTCQAAKDWKSDFPVHARLPEPEPEHDSDEPGAGDEMVAHDAEARQALAGDRASDSQVAGLAASGLWEHDDDAEDFFAKGLEIIQVARRKDESARRRYVPPKDKRAVRRAQGGDADGGKGHTPRSRAGRVRKKTDHFGKSKIKGQHYVKDGDEIEQHYADGTETESDGDSDREEGAVPKPRQIKMLGSETGTGEGSPRARKPRAPKKRQDASAVMIDKVLRSDVDAKKVRFDQAGKAKLKELASCFLGGLLGRPQLCGTMSERAVKQAIRSWLPALGGVGELLRCSLPEAARPALSLTCCCRLPDANAMLVPCAEQGIRRACRGAHRAEATA